MSDRKSPIFGVMSLVLMAGLAIAAILVTIYVSPPPAASNGESLAVAVGAVANIVATLLVIGVVSLTSIILAGISFLRRERPWPAALAMSLATASLLVIIVTITQL